MRIGKILLPALTLFLASAGGASAHLEGQTFERVTGDSTIEIGVDRVEILPGVPTSFSFALIRDHKRPGWRYAESDDVLVTISDGGGEAVHRETISTETSPQFVSYAFPGNGIYDVDVRYRRDGLQIAETSVTLVATRNLNIDVLDWYVVFALAAGAYVGLLYGLLKKRA